MMSLTKCVTLATRVSRKTSLKIFQIVFELQRSPAYTIWSWFAFDMWAVTLGRRKDRVVCFGFVEHKRILSSFCNEYTEVFWASQTLTKHSRFYQSHILTKTVMALSLVNYFILDMQVRIKSSLCVGSFSCQDPSCHDCSALFDPFSVLSFLLSLFCDGFS